MLWVRQNVRTWSKIWRECGNHSVQDYYTATRIQLSSDFNNTASHRSSFRKAQWVSTLKPQTGLFFKKNWWTLKELCDPDEATPWHREWHRDPKQLHQSLDPSHLKWGSKNFDWNMKPKCDKCIYLIAPPLTLLPCSRWNRRYIFGLLGLRPSDRGVDLAMWMHVDWKQV